MLFSQESLDLLARGLSGYEKIELTYYPNGKVETIKHYEKSGESYILRYTQELIWDGENLITIKTNKAVV